MSRRVLNKCSECGGIFQKKQYLNVHIRRFHENIAPPKRKRQLDGSSKEGLCNICGLMFATRKILLKHIDNHNRGALVKNDIQSRRVQCPMEKCCEMVKHYQMLRKHLKEAHNVDLECQKFTFDTRQDFENWKDKIQEETFAFYARDSGSLTSANGKKRYYANCHRSYAYRRKGNSIKSVKSGGTNKIGKTCPARLEILENSGIFTVKWWSTHIGHKCEPQRMLLSKKIKDEIANRLQQGEAVDKILLEFREKGSKEGLKRLECLTRIDIRNIIRDYHISYKPKVTSIEEHTQHNCEDDGDPSSTTNVENQRVEYANPEVKKLSDDTRSFQNIVREKTNSVVALSNQVPLTEEEKGNVLFHFEKIIDILYKKRFSADNFKAERVDDVNCVTVAEEGTEGQFTSSKNNSAAVHFVPNDLATFYVDCGHDYFSN